MTRRRAHWFLMGATLVFITHTFGSTSARQPRIFRLILEVSKQSNEPIVIHLTVVVMPCMSYDFHSLDIGKMPEIS